jgi:hypothetical protein
MVVTGEQFGGGRALALWECPVGVGSGLAGRPREA